MSFYDLTKNTALSGQDLFKRCLKRDSTIPSRGGQKDFEPDGSWLQSKAVEAFIQERTSVLGEARVEKLKSLVQGTWEPDKKLVNVDKTGKFWAHMGFTDKRRNWLYPEEALFLMETNALEVYEHGIPLSIQEAYSKFLSVGNMSLEEYQVFAHLRRLGYVVLRHEEQPILTEYERKLNLDKYISKQTLKERKSKFLQKKKTSEEKRPQTESTSADQSDQTGAVSQGLTGVEPTDCTETGSSLEVSSVPEEGSSLCVSAGEKRLRDEEIEESQTVSKKLCSQTESDPSSNKDSSPNGNGTFYDSSWSSCFAPTSKLSTENTAHAELTKPLQQTALSDNEACSFPNIAGKDILTMRVPSTSLLPSNLELPESDQCLFDVEQYRIKHPSQSLDRQAQREEERDTRIRALDFSFAEWTQRKPKVKASNWREYKHKVSQRMQELAAASPVDHLWQGDVTPLISPQEATSYGAILSKLCIIQSLENKDLEPQSSSTEEFRISYDVHLPDHQFKKSMPGVPNHRVYVTRCASEPVSLPQIQQYWHMYKDDVPLHCAVVDSGEIAFYIFDNLKSLEKLA